uniref:Uncharacterized protein n=1 Tax=Anguilla anguilla TaxID=7936 RepID=A0A0E9WNI1_ANGAN
MHGLHHENQGTSAGGGLRVHQAAAAPYLPEPQLHGAAASARDRAPPFCDAYAYCPLQSGQNITARRRLRSQQYVRGIRVQLPNILSDSSVHSDPGAPAEFMPDNRVALI